MKKIGFFNFTLIYALFNLCAFHWPLYKFVLTVSDFTQLSSLIALGALSGLQILLIFLLFGGLSIFGVKVLKAVAIMLLLINATALYYMVSYNIEIDRTMVGNILNTDTSEATGLFHYSLLFWVLPLGVLPGVICAIWPLSLPRWYWRPFLPLLSIMAIVAVVWSVAITWPWFDAHASRLGARLLPWSYIANTARYYERIARDERIIIPLADAEKQPRASGHRRVVVLVIGESARAQNFDYYGYERATNPFTRAAGFRSLPVSAACASYTTAGVACMLSHKGKQAGEFSSDEPLPSYLQRLGVQVYVRKNNSGLPPLSVAGITSAADHLAECDTKACSEGPSDGYLLAGLPAQLKANDADDLFIVLHISGSHGPAYYQKSPPHLKQFLPECETVQVRDCPRQHLINAYDNSILYTDHLLAELAKMLGQLENSETLILYVSDHGESLGEHNLFLHGAPKAVAPSEQLNIPFLVWANETFITAKAGDQAFAPKQNIAAQDAIFHTVLGAFSFAGGPYRKELDIFANQAGLK